MSRLLNLAKLSKYKLLDSAEAVQLMTNPESSSKQNEINAAITKIDNIIKAECRLGNDEFILKIANKSLFKTIKIIIDSFGYTTRTMNVDFTQAESLSLYVTWNILDKPVSVTELDKIKKYDI